MNKIIFDQTSLCRTGEYLKSVHTPCRVALVTDYTAGALYAADVSDSLAASGFRVFLFAFEPGESSKNLETLGKILDFLADSEITRSDLCLALGGGVVGDITGFASAIYQRGIGFAGIPTTLLAMVDSSIGGKTGIDLPAGKNLCGAFHEPLLTVICPKVLDSLPEKFYDDGIAEIIKYALLGNPRLLEILRTCSSESRKLKEPLKPYLTEVIQESVNTKNSFIEGDLYDLDRRRFLNLGHTIGHAVEHASGYAITHGHAVATGMCAIARAGESLGFTEQGVAAEIEKLISGCGLPSTTIISPEDLTTSALSDKKRTGEEIALVFPETVGHCIIEQVPVSRLREIITLGVR